MYVCMYVNIYIYANIYIHVYIYMYAYIYICSKYGYHMYIYVYNDPSFQSGWFYGNHPSNIIQLACNPLKVDNTVRKAAMAVRSSTWDGIPASYATLPECSCLVRWVSTQRKTICLQVK